MVASGRPKRIFVAGATGFIGLSVVYALLAGNAHVTALIPPGASLPLRDSSGRLRLVEADAWNRASLNGRSRGHDAVINLLGAIRQQPARGLSYHHLNVDSLQNVARMVVSDGVPHLIYLSASGAPWLPREYVASKREAEVYLRRSGCVWTIVRAPLAYPRGQLHNPLLILTSLLGGIPLFGRPFERWAPLPVDLMGRGLAQLAISGERHGQILYGHQIRQLARLLPVGPRAVRPVPRPQLDPADPFHVDRVEDTSTPEDEVPFGWLP